MIYYNDIKELTNEQVISILNDMQRCKLIRILDYPDGITIKIRPTLSSIASNGVEEWIDEYRKLFQGKKPGAMGDKNACITKMQEFIQANPRYSKDTILAATQKYINTLNDYKYLMKADNFISVSKDNTKAGRRSELLAYCEEEAEGINRSFDFGEDA